MVEVRIREEKCTGCARCVEVCPAGVFGLEEERGRKVARVVRGEECCACRACELKCPEGAIEVEGYQLLKVDPPPDYPPEEGRYLRGNDYSPVAVCAILDTYDFRIPPELLRLVEVGVEAGAALAGTLQTENIGIEKLVANVVANPNLRYLVLCWRESQGHLPAHSLLQLVEKGVANDKRRTILGSRAPAPYLPNLPLRSIERFRKQITIVNLISEEEPRRGMDPENVKKAVWACLQEKPVEFMGYTLWDPGAWPEPPICEKLSMRVREPWRPELTKEEADALERIRRAAERIGRSRRSG
ncbi:MAG: tetrahydromethanopterin S-methyltransferase subunit A [Candidatus Hadarchaeales archaeon]